MLRVSRHGSFSWSARITYGRTASTRSSRTNSRLWGPSASASLHPLRQLPTSSASVEAIKKASPDVIISTVVGDSNEPFYQRLQAAGILPESIPVLVLQYRRRRAAQASASRHGRGLRGLGLFPVDRPAREPGVRPKVQGDLWADRVTSDVIEAAYYSVLLVGASRCRSRD